MVFAFEFEVGFVLCPFFFAREVVENHERDRAERPIACHQCAPDPVERVAPEEDDRKRYEPETRKVRECDKQRTARVEIGRAGDPERRRARDEEDDGYVWCYD